MNKLKKITAIIIVFTIFLSACTNNKDSTKQRELNNKINIVTTLFPYYDFAKQIGQDKVNVELLLPVGTNSHSFEPTPSDIVKINNSDIFIFTGYEMEVWAKNILNNVSNNTKIITASDNIVLDKVKSTHSHDHSHHDENKKNTREINETEEFLYEVDPHIWTSPKNAKIIVDNILSGLIEKDETNKDFYTQNATAYKEQLDLLDNEFKTIVKNKNKDEIIFAGKFPFHYFVKEYNLPYISAFDSCGEEAEPNPKTMTKIIDEIKKDNIKVVFHEELAPTNVAKTIEEETGAKPLLLHSAHNLTKKEFESNMTYIDIMKNNAKNLKEGLE